MRFIGLLLVIAGCGGAYRTYNEWKVGSNATSQARQVSFEQLCTDGAKGNPHVKISNFEFGLKYTFSKRKHGESYTKVWIPLFSKSTSGNAGQGIRVLVRTTKVPNPAELEKFCAQATLQGLIINELDSLPSDHQAELLRSDPGTDFANCVMVDEGREPITLAGELLNPPASYRWPFASM